MSWPEVKLYHKQIPGGIEPRLVVISTRPPLPAIKYKDRESAMLAGSVGMEISSAPACRTRGAYVLAM